MYREAPIDKNGLFDYLEFTRILKHGAKDKDDQWTELLFSIVFIVLRFTFRLPPSQIRIYMYFILNY